MATENHCTGLAADCSHSFVVTGATPLGAMKFEQVTTSLGDLFMGSTGGSLA